MGKNNRGAWKNALLVAFGTFFLAVVISLGSQYLLGKLTSLILSFVLLMAIILTGIIFDIIGVAAAVADEAPFHARAAKRLNGASQSILLVRNADRVANFCNDVVGDVAGTLSGAIGAAIALRLAFSQPGAYELLAVTTMAGVVAAVTVGGKALGKSMAINQAVQIVWRVSLILAWLENSLGIRLLAGLPKKGRR
ncbi:hypothetical protein SY88_07025 [Clostridiales bacterium PH28_bin88]|nr:hypothetical protein SY88_07025 [Clostridiales bacterium PH28_bin88]